MITDEIGITKATTKLCEGMALIAPDSIQCQCSILPDVSIRSDINYDPVEVQKSDSSPVTMDKGRVVTESSPKVETKRKRSRRSRPHKKRFTTVVEDFPVRDSDINNDYTSISAKDARSINKVLHDAAPPKSPYFLIHEALRHNPWKLLVATILLENTKGQRVIPVIWKIFNNWPTPELASQADLNKVADFIFPIGNNYQKAEAIIKFSYEFLTKKWTYPIELQGIGKYGNDSYRIFCLNEWQQVEPADQMLLRYCLWLKSNAE